MTTLHLALIFLASLNLGARCKICEGSGHNQSNPAALKAFRWLHPCPSTGQWSGACPGYSVSHTVPLACGGPDVPRNMQWKTKAQIKAIEQRGCAKRVASVSK
jgi:hypothetical protein